MKIPSKIIASPITDRGFIGSFRMKNVHMRERNGVMYARLDTLAVPPFLRATAQVTVASARIKIPFQAIPSISHILTAKLSPVIILMTALITNVAKNAIIIDTRSSYSCFWLSAVNAPYEIAARTQKSTPVSVEELKLRMSFPATVMTPKKASEKAMHFLAVSRKIYFSNCKGDIFRKRPLPSLRQRPSLR